MRIPLAVIEQARQALESAPANQALDVTKAEGVQLLLPQILAMQSKGYALATIAEMLSNHGFDVSRVALKVGLRRAQSGAARRPRRKGRKGKDAPPSLADAKEAAGDGAPPEDIEVLAMDSVEAEGDWGSLRS